MCDVESLSDIDKTKVAVELGKDMCDVESLLYALPHSLSRRLGKDMCDVERVVIKAIPLLMT